MSEEFYLSLPSHSGTAEFPNNKNNSFKIRLPRPMRLEGSGWQVGLSAISLPDVNINLKRYKEITEPLLRVKWFQVRDQVHAKEPEHVMTSTTEVTFPEIYHYGNIRDGIDFFKALIVKYEQKKKDDLPAGWDTMTPMDKLLEPVFRWEGEDLILDNAQLDQWAVKAKVQDSTHGAPFEISFDKHIGIDFGWVAVDKNGKLSLGPNIVMEFEQTALEDDTRYKMRDGSKGSGKISDIVRDGVIKERALKRVSKVPEPYDTDDVEPKTHAGTQPSSTRYWRQTNKRDGTENRIHLSCVCNWRFMNIRRAFEDVVGGVSRSLFVYSDAGGSTVVGNRVTDLLREVRFHSEGSGSQYFEPVHIQYIPVRKQVLDIIEVNVAETTGELARLGVGNTILTLHFRR